MPISKEALAVIEQILARKHGGVLKRLDEHREFVCLLKHLAPDFIAQNPHIEDWLRAQDEFLAALGDASGLLTTNTRYPRKSPF